MKNICILRKYAAILAMSLCSMVSAFAQGAVIGYAAGGDWIKTGGYTYTGFPNTAQLQMLTHVIASDIGCYSVSNVYTSPFSSGPIQFIFIKQLELT